MGNFIFILVSSGFVAMGERRWGSSFIVVVAVVLVCCRCVSLGGGFLGLGAWLLGLVLALFLSLFLV